MNCSIKLKNALVLNFPVPVKRSQGWCGVDGVERGLASVILHCGAGLTVHHGHHWVEMQSRRVVVATASRGKEASLLDLWHHLFWPICFQPHHLFDFLHHS